MHPLHLLHIFLTSVVMPTGFVPIIIIVPGTLEQLWPDGYPEVASD